MSSEQWAAHETLGHPRPRNYPRCCKFCSIWRFALRDLKAEWYGENRDGRLSAGDADFVR